MMEGVSGWIFKNESDCFNFFKEGGSIANYRTCPTKNMNSTSTSSLMMKKEECGMMGGSSWSSCCPCCPPVWDGFLCWPPTSINTVVEQPCPANIHQINSNSKERRQYFCEYFKFFMRFLLKCETFLTSDFQQNVQFLDNYSIIRLSGIFAENSEKIRCSACLKTHAFFRFCIPYLQCGRLAPGGWSG